MLTAIRDEWLAIGLSTSPTDKAGAYQGVCSAYEAAGLSPPKHQLWLASPLQGSIACAILSRVRTQIRDQNVQDRVGTQVWDQVWAQVGAQIWMTACYGLHDAEWLSSYDALIRLGIDGPKRLMGHMQVARCSGWWWPFSDTVIMTERPVVLVRDDRYRLHCETGPAISYSDGWGIWAWHGVRVPQQVIEAPQTLSANEITIERNSEIRRVMIERFGQERYIRESGAKLIHRDDWGSLWRAELNGDEDLVMVQVTNSTPEPDGTFKDYWLRVPPAMRRAHEAVAWTFEQKEDDYSPVVQT